MNLNNFDFSFGFKDPAKPLLYVMGIVALLFLVLPSKGEHYSIDINPWNIPVCDESNQWGVCKK